MEPFQVDKYLGKWYELMHYPSWFQRNDNYNTTAEYTITGPGIIQVHNSTISNGKKFESFGTGYYIGDSNFKVVFPMPEVVKLETSGQFKKSPFDTSQIDNVSTKDSKYPNYVVDRIFVNRYGEYVFAIVTDFTRASLYVLSRYAHPSIVAYNQIMKYVIANYDRDRLVQTPHLY